VIADKVSNLFRAYGFIYQSLTVFAEDSHLKDVFGKIDRDGGSIVHGMGSFGCGDRSTLTGFPVKGEESIPLRHGVSLIKLLENTFQ
jgi:hypothetical protein